MKELSIIIPHYNSVELLEKLINSIPNRNEIEVIVVDDRSDKQVEKLNKLMQDYKFQHITFIENDRKIKSAGTCRNIGLDHANGKWLLFADSDDFFVDNFYEIVKKHFNAVEDVIFFKPTSIFIDTNEVADRHVQYAKLVENYLEDRSLKNETRIRFQHPVPWAKMIKRDLVESKNIRFDEVIAMNDIMFSTKVGYYLKSFDISDSVIYCVTRNKGSLTMKMSNDVHEARTEAYIRYCNFIKSNLDKKQQKYLELIGIRTLLRAYRSKLGFKVIFNTYRKFKRNNIEILDIRFLNPLFLIDKIYQYYNNHKKEKKYYQN